MFLYISVAFLRDLLFSTAVLSLSVADFLSCPGTHASAARVGSDRASTEIKLRAITPPGFVGYENDHTLFLLDFFLARKPYLLINVMYREFQDGFRRILAEVYTDCEIKVPYFCEDNSFHSG